MYKYGHFYIPNILGSVRKTFQVYVSKIRNEFLSSMLYYNLKLYMSDNKAQIYYKLLCFDNNIAIIKD